MIRINYSLSKWTLQRNKGNIPSSSYVVSLVVCRSRRSFSATRNLAVNDTAESKNTNKNSSTSIAYMDLAKAKLSALVVATTAAGFVAAGQPIASQMDVLAACLVGTSLCSSSAAAFNQIFEVERDRRMKRTAHRPLVTGKLTIPQATTAATLWGLTGTGLLVAFTDPITATLGAGNIFLYAGIYTYMKPISIYNTWVGAVVGAIPPVMGWTAATGGSVFDIEPLLLGAVLYYWQMPHFFALSFMHRVDYKRGGFAMLPCLEEDGEKTADVITRYAWYLSTIPFIATVAGVTSSMFALEGIALNAYALRVAYRFKHQRTNTNSRKIFLTSLWYLPSLLMLFLIHSKKWDDDKEDIITGFLSKNIHLIREKGREFCLHETAAQNTHNKEKCPVSLGKEESQKAVQMIRENTSGTVSGAVKQASREL